MKKHTPAPWHIEQDNPHSLLTICDNNDFDICEMVPYMDLYEEEEMMANANLIAATPELLDALMAANAVFVSLGIDSLNRIVGEQVKQVRATIKKCTEL